MGSTNSGKSKPYLCPYSNCKAAFSKPCRREVHIRTHLGERPFVCGESHCGKTYTNKAHLRRHIVSVHISTQEIACNAPGCGQILSNKYSLKKHYKQKHTSNSNRFACLICSESFKKKQQLNIHVSSHTGKPRFICDICNIGFTTGHLYKKHLRNHKTYTCDCGEILNRWTVFCAHRRNCAQAKKEHKCIICNKTFSTKTNLTQHGLTHVLESQKETYKCPYINCSRSYTLKKNLTHHVKVFHEKANEYVQIKCTQENCETILKSERNLKQHIQNIHGTPKKTKKNARRPRKDKGFPRHQKPMAFKLSGLNIKLSQLKPSERDVILNRGRKEISDDKQESKENGGKTSDNKAKTLNLKTNGIKKKSTDTKILKVNIFKLNISSDYNANNEKDIDTDNCTASKDTESESMLIDDTVNSEIFKLNKSSDYNANNKKDIDLDNCSASKDAESEIILIEDTVNSKICKDVSCETSVTYQIDLNPREANCSSCTDKESEVMLIEENLNSVIIVPSEANLNTRSDKALSFNLIEENSNLKIFNTISDKMSVTSEIDENSCKDIKNYENDVNTLENINDEDLQKRCDEVLLALHNRGVLC